MSTKNDVFDIQPGTIYRIDFKEDNYEPEIDETLLAMGRDGVTSAMESLIRIVMGIGWPNQDYALNKMRRAVERAASRVANIEVIVASRVASTEVNGDLAQRSMGRAVANLAKLKADVSRAEFIIEFINSNDTITADTPVDADDERLLDVFQDGAAPIALNLFHVFLTDLDRHDLDIFIPLVYGHGS